jgi:thioesterase domain-containing protein
MFSTRQTLSPSPSLLLAGLEPTRAVLDLARSWVAPAREPVDGKQHPVLVIPGLGGSSHSTWLLRQRLSGQNFKVRDWGQGINKGPPTPDITEWLRPLAELVRQLSDEAGEQVSLVGWSLGGIVARELSKTHAKHVRRVITLGTPITGLDTATNAKWAYDLWHRQPGVLQAEQAKSLAEEPPVPTLAVYSKSDGVVGWRACVQPDAQRTRHLEVNATSHLGLVLCPLVLHAVLDELSQKAGRGSQHARD